MEFGTQLKTIKSALLAQITPQKEGEHATPMNVKTNQEKPGFAPVPTHLPSANKKTKQVVLAGRINNVGRCQQTSPWDHSVRRPT
jgi:hypothetical protein